MLSFSCLGVSTIVKLRFKIPPPPPIPQSVVLISQLDLARGRILLGKPTNDFRTYLIN